MNSPIRILLADDHCMVRVGLASILHSEPDLRVVAEAENATEAIARFREHSPDVSLLDVRMSGGGIEALRAIRGEFPASRVIMVTTHDREEYIFAAVEAGACGYLLKSADEAGVVHAVRQVNAGNTYITASNDALIAERRQARSLTPREVEILQLVYKGLHNKEIGSVLGLSEFTVKGHLSSIIGKLGAGDRTEAVVVALQNGILDLD